MDIKEKILKSNSCNIFSRISENELNELVNLTSFLPINSDVRKRYYYVKNEITSTAKCKMCNNEPNFFGKSYAIYCSSNCRKNDTSNKKDVVKELELRESIDLLINFPDDYVKCEICGVATKSIFSHLQRHKDWSTEKYKLTYPNSLIISKNESKRLSFNRTGERNNNHKSKTTLEQRQLISPFSKNFKKYENDNDRDEFLKTFDIINPTQKKYWINKGFSEEAAIKKVSERQKTFTLEKCIAKLGEVEGIIKWKARQLQWSNSYQKRSYSLISQELFKEIFKTLNKEQQFNCRFAQWDFENAKFIEKGRNFEQRLFCKDKLILPDFILGTKIIEFDGEYWHNHNRQQSGNTIKDKIRDSYLIEAGYEVLHIPEKLYKQNKNNVIDTCLQFLKNN